MRDDTQPRYPQADVRIRYGAPYCDSCGRLLQWSGQVRCPYVRCRAWLRGSLTPEPRSQRQSDRAARARN